jgi:hypothetical protein
MPRQPGARCNSLSICVWSASGNSRDLNWFLALKSPVVLGDHWCFSGLIGDNPAPASVVARSRTPVPVPGPGPGPACLAVGCGLRGAATAAPRCRESREQGGQRQLLGADGGRGVCGRGYGIRDQRSGGLRLDPDEQPSGFCIELFITPRDFVFSTPHPRFVFISLAR